jgi:lactoylglutathione lyase
LRCLEGRPVHLRQRAAICTQTGVVTIAPLDQRCLNMAARRGLIRRGPSPCAASIAKETTMKLGAFSISLAVKDIEASRAFYEKLGFGKFGGNAAQNWLILKNGDHIIGLFQGMFEKNILTFNPGWDQDAKPVDGFTDVRELQRRLKASGVALTSEADESTTGPASFTMLDPDGNPILVDQHV